MTTNQQINQAVIAFLVLLGQANSVVADSPVLSSWETHAPNGDPDNQVVKFTWEDTDGNYSLTLTEGGIASGQWGGDSFFCVDHEGDEVQITLYRNVTITPSTSDQG